MSVSSSLFEYCGGHCHHDYDLAGNMVVRNKGTTWNQRMTWDSHNRLAEMTGAGVSEGYLYDASGQRIRKANLLLPNSFTWVPFSNYEQTGSSISTATRYYSFGGAVVAMRTGGASFSYLYGDGVQSTVYTTDASGNVTSARGYRVFGGTRTSSGTMPTDRHFTGQQEDATGIYYYGARYYDPQLGQFLSPDTLVPDPTLLIDYNRYGYSRGNPLKYNDPSGHCASNEDGSRNLKDDADCWFYVDEIIKLWNDDPGYWNGLFKDQDTWLEELAPLSFFDKDWMFGQYETYLGSSSFLHVYNKQQAERALLPTQEITYGPDPCEIWDCVALGLDTTSLAATVFQDTSLLSTPVTGPLGLLGDSYGEVIGTSADLAGLGRTAQQRYLGKASDIDVAVGVATFTAGRIPILGIAASGGQLVYDLASPLLPW